MTNGREQNKKYMKEMKKIIHPDLMGSVNEPYRGMALTLPLLLMMK